MMPTFVLILWISWNTSTMAITSVPNFREKAECEAAGKAAVDTFSVNYAKFVCVKQSKV